MFNILTYVRVAPATADVHIILEVPETDKIHIEDRYDLAEAYCKTWSGVEWICKTWSGFVKGGFVKHGFVKHGFVKHGFVKGGFVKHGFVKGGFVKGGFVKHGFVKGGFVKHDNLKLKRVTRKVRIFFFSRRSNRKLCRGRNSIERNRMLSYNIMTRSCASG